MESRRIERDSEVAGLVSLVVGEGMTFVSSCLETSALVFARLWVVSRTNSWKPLSPAALYGASSALDALAAARRNLIAADIPGVYIELRRSFEGQMLALAAIHDAGIADAWLRGKHLSPRDLRTAVERAEPSTKADLRRMYALLSSHAHGQVEATAVYANRWGRFEWPPTADCIDPHRIRGAFDYLVMMVWNFSTIEWRATAGWTNLDDRPLEAFARKNYDLLAYYVGHLTPGRGESASWIATNRATAAEWLSLEPRPDEVSNQSH